MVKSMTGYGRAVETVNGREFTVEIRSVNNRYLDCTVKLPRSFSFAEEAVKAAVKAAVSRGKVDVYISVRSETEADVQVTLNKPVLEGYFAAISDRREHITVQSFGFKHGTPRDIDLLLDARFLPNPYYDLELRPQTGLDAPVRDYVLASGKAEELVTDVVAFVRKWLKAYADTGRPRLTVAIGCTGGQHRSVYLCEKLRQHFSDSVENTQIRHKEFA